MEDLKREVRRELEEMLVGLRINSVVAVGAEAAIVDAYWGENRVIIKYRYRKLYRTKILDNYLRSSRTQHEAKLLLRALSVGVSVPSVLFVDKSRGILVIDYVEGVILKDVVNTLESSKLERVFKSLGSNVGRLHEAGIIHGDLTTSNVVLTPEERIVLIDFGLGEFSNELELQGVDVHLFLRILESTHTSLSKILYEYFIEGYESIRGEKTKLVLDKVSEIRMRGRYIASRRRSIRLDLEGIKY